MTRRGAVGIIGAAAVVQDAQGRTPMDYSFVTASEAAAAIRAKQISSAELTALIFQRIDRYQPKLNAFVYQMREEAQAAARAADAAVAAKKELPPLHGVPL